MDNEQMISESELGELARRVGELYGGDCTLELKPRAGRSERLTISMGGPQGMRLCLTHKSGSAAAAAQLRREAKQLLLKLLHPEQVIGSI